MFHRISKVYPSVSGSSDRALLDKRMKAKKVWRLIKAVRAMPVEFGDWVGRYLDKPARNKEQGSVVWYHVTIFTPVATYLHRSVAAETFRQPLVSLVGRGDLVS